jgi:hypothetical protein
VSGPAFPKNWVAVAVSLDEKPEDARALLPGVDSRAYPLFLVFDSGRRFAEAMGSYQYPETFLIDETGHWVRKWVGPQDWERIAAEGAAGGSR